MTSPGRNGPRSRTIWTIARKEFLDNVWNRWIIAISVIFVILALVVSYFGGAQIGGGTGFRGLVETVIGVVAVEVFLVPILGLMLSYGSIVGESERGSIHLLLSMPVTRAETLLGKFVGLSAVMLVAILSGLGVSGAVIVISVGPEGWQEYLLFILGSAAFALVFVSVGLLLSTLAKGRSTAMGLAVFLWFFFVMIFDFLLVGIYVATGGTISFLPGEISTLPDWFYASGLVNPPDAFTYFVTVVFGLTAAFGFSYEIPGFVNEWTSSLSLVLWVVVPLSLALWRFQRRDL